MSAYESHLAGRETALYDTKTVETELHGVVADIRVECEIWQDKDTLDLDRLDTLSDLVNEALTLRDQARALGIAA